MPLKTSPQTGNWQSIKRIVSTAALAGLLAGLSLTMVQQWQVRPLIQQAELIEQAATEAHEHAQPAHAHSESSGPDHTHVHQHADEAHGDATTAQHQAAQWQPAEGTERLMFTALANISLAVGFALLLTSALFLHGGSTGWRAGLAWGLGGYLVFFIAPSIGLPPELPGTVSAPLAARQLWWISTVASAGAGLALLYFGRRSLKIIGILFLLLPFLIGAPHPDIAAESLPHALTQAFVIATALANGLFWLVLGTSTAQLYKKFSE